MELDLSAFEPAMRGSMRLANHGAPTMAMAGTSASSR